MDVKTSLLGSRPNEKEDLKTYFKMWTQGLISKFFKNLKAKLCLKAKLTFIQPLINFGFKQRQTTQVIDIIILAMFCVKELAREWVGRGGGL